MSTEESKCIVFEMGSDASRVGFAGDDEPQCIFPTIVGKPLAASEGSNDFYIGNEAKKSKDTLNLSYPIKRGVITNWDDMESIWYYAFYNELQVDPNAHYVMLTESPFSPSENREKVGEILFEKFGIPALNIVNEAALPIFAAGNMNGITIISGHETTHINSIVKGVVVASEKLNFGGSDLTEYFMKILNRKGHSLSKSEDEESIRKIKEDLCYATLHYDRDLQEVATDNTLKNEYELSDGRVLDINDETFRCPEALFNPSLLDLSCYGIHECVYRSIAKCPADIRKKLYNCIVLSGGNLCFSGLEERMEKEVTKLAPHDAKVKIVPLDNNTKKCNVWMGASVLAISPGYQDKMFITKTDYEDTGASIMQRNK